MVCLTAALSLPQLSTEVGRIGQAHCYREPEYDGRDHVCVLPVKYAVNIYQTLPKAGTIPKPPSDQGEETPTKCYQDLCSRCETLWHFRFGLPTLTNLPIWLGSGHRMPLPSTTAWRQGRVSYAVRCIGCGGLLDYPNRLCTWHRQGCDEHGLIGLRLGRIHID